MPNLLNNILYILLLTVSMGCASHSMQWKSNKKAAEN